MPTGNHNTPSRLRQVRVERAVECDLHAYSKCRIHKPIAVGIVEAATTKVKSGAEQACRNVAIGPARMIRGSRIVMPSPEQASMAFAVPGGVDSSGAGSCCRASNSAVGYRVGTPAL